MYSLPKGFGVLCYVLFISVITGCQSTNGKAADQTMNDAAISVAVQGKLMSDRVSNFLHVDVNTEGGVVTLSGIVETNEQRAQAERLAHEVEGVLRVKNRLQIQNRLPAGTPSQPNQPPDTNPPMTR